MGTYIQASIEASDVIDAMDEAATFSVEMWMALAEGLQQGMLFDNAADLFAQETPQICASVATQLERLAATICNDGNPND